MVGFTGSIPVEHAALVIGPIRINVNESLEKHYVSRRSRSQKGVLVFLARDAEQRVMCYANAHVPKSEKADEILRFVEFWKQQTGQLPVLVKQSHQEIPDTERYTKVSVSSRLV